MFLPASEYVCSPTPPPPPPAPHISVLQSRCISMHCPRNLKHRIGSSQQREAIKKRCHVPQAIYSCLMTCEWDELVWFGEMYRNTCVCVCECVFIWSGCLCVCVCSVDIIRRLAHERRQQRAVSIKRTHIAIALWFNSCHQRPSPSTSARRGGGVVYTVSWPNVCQLNGSGIPANLFAVTHSRIRAHRHQRTAA